MSTPNSRVCGIYTVFHDKQVLESEAWIYILKETVWLYFLILRDSLEETMICKNCPAHSVTSKHSINLVIIILYSAKGKVLF